MMRTALILLLSLMPALPATAQDMRAQLSERTFAFRADISFPEPVVLERGRGATSLGAAIAITYLKADGSLRLKRWNEPKGDYEPVIDGRWTVEQNVLCLIADWSALKRDRFCMRLRIDNPIAAGHGVGIDALIKGDLRPGNPDKL